jgi:hypothetical protein
VSPAAIVVAGVKSIVIAFAVPATRVAELVLVTAVGAPANAAIGSNVIMNATSVKMANNFLFFKVNSLLKMFMGKLPISDQLQI